jgi:hypothetical protein
MQESPLAYRGDGVATNPQAGSYAIGISPRRAIPNRVSAAGMGILVLTLENGILEDCTFQDLLQSNLRQCYL